MKVFVYDKKDSERIAEYKHVIRVEEFKTDPYIYITTDEMEVYQYNTNLVKTRIYQN